MVEEWVNKARNDANSEVNLRLETVKALRALKEENKDLLSKLITEERERKSAQAGLKTAEAQAEDQCKLFYQTGIELATSKQLALDLKAELQKVKEAAQLAREAAEVEKQASYILDVEETQAKLTEELVEACKDYSNVTWDEAFNVAGVPVDSALRQPGGIYYHSDVREVLDAQTAFVLEASEQSLVAQIAFPPPEALKGSSETGNQGQGAEGAKDKGKGKGTKPLSEAKDVAKAKEVKVKAKEAEAKTKEVNLKAKDTPTFQQSQKEAPPPPKAKA